MLGSTLGANSYLQRFSALFVVLAALLAFPSVEAQEAFPNKPVKIVVPYPAGGATDTASRIFAQGMGELLGQPFVIENKPGGGTNIAASFVARSAPDGYTLYVANFASHAVNKWLYNKLTYDPDKDFAPVAIMVRAALFLIVSPSLPVRSVQELIDLAKEKPDALSYASVGIGSPQHIVGELFRMSTDIDVVHVPYKGAAAVTTDLVTGRVQFMFDATAMSYVHTGRLKALAVAYSERWPTEPNIPSMAELGFPQVSAITFFALVAPAGTPIAILDKLNEAARTVAKRPEVAAKLGPIGLLPTVATRKETADFLLEQSTKWAPVVKASGAKVN